MALQSDGFVDIDFPTLTSVLSRETLNCREIILFEAALSWAEAECTRQEIDPSPDNKRKVGVFDVFHLVLLFQGSKCDLFNLFF